MQLYLVDRVKSPKAHSQTIEVDLDSWGRVEESEFNLLQEMETFELTELSGGMYVLETDSDCNIVG